MLISLIHPSRGRAKKAFECYSTWMLKTSCEHEIEHILSLDSDDPELPKYRDNFGNIIVNNNTCVVEATNHAAKIAKGYILIYLSDDFLCPENWDKLIYEAIKDRINQPCLLKVDDCLQKFYADVVTIPIVTKILYDKLRYFWNPIYKSMFVDQDLYYVCKNNNWLLERPDLKFEHQHYSIGKAVKDSTYTRSDANWNQGQTIFNERKRRNFPI
jgi:hypothetical protein